MGGETESWPGREGWGRGNSAAHTGSFITPINAFSVQETC